MVGLALNKNRQEIWMEIKSIINQHWLNCPGLKDAELKSGTFDQNPCIAFMSLRKNNLMAALQAFQIYIYLTSRKNRRIIFCDYDEETLEHFLKECDCALCHKIYNHHGYWYGHQNHIIFSIQYMVAVNNFQLLLALLRGSGQCARRP